MKKFILTIALATSGLGGLVTSAQAHGFCREHECREHECHEYEYCRPYFYGCHDNDDCGYWYWQHGCRFWRAPRHCR
jgi:hypothetical protein